MVSLVLLQLSLCRVSLVIAQTILFPHSPHPTDTTHKMVWAITYWCVQISSNIDGHGFDPFKSYAHPNPTRNNNHSWKINVIQNLWSWVDVHMGMNMGTQCWALVGYDYWEVLWYNSRSQWPSQQHEIETYNGVHTQGLRPWKNARKILYYSCEKHNNTCNT